MLTALFGFVKVHNDRRDYCRYDQNYYNIYHTLMSQCVFGRNAPVRF